LPSPFPPPEPSAIPSPSSNPFDSVAFPQDICGDQLPKTRAAYPVSLYPVAVTYNEKNLERVKAEFCKDALATTAQGSDRKFIQVAAFTTVERANDFRDFMKEKLGSGEVREPSVISQIPDTLAAAADEEEKVQSGFQKFVLDCHKFPAGQVLDVEFSECRALFGSIIIKFKNYSGA
jgi:hypothetical protein